MTEYEFTSTMQDIKEKAIELYNPVSKFYSADSLLVAIIDMSNQEDLKLEKYRKILNIEDTMGKHWDINRALNWNRCPAADNATTAEEGLAKIEQAIVEGKPYELLITDMHFPLNGIPDEEAGMYVIKELKSRGIQIPIIVCSSVRYNIPEILGCVFYSKNRDMNFDFKELLDK